MFANSFNVVSIYCVARELGASYKCPTLHGSSLQQHSFLVSNVVLFVCAGEYL